MYNFSIYEIKVKDEKCKICFKVIVFIYCNLAKFSKFKFHFAKLSKFFILKSQKKSKSALILLILQKMCHRPAVINIYSQKWIQIQI